MYITINCTDNISCIGCINNNISVQNYNTEILQISMCKYMLNYYPILVYYAKTTIKHIYNKTKYLTRYTTKHHVLPYITYDNVVYIVMQLSISLNNMLCIALLHHTLVQIHLINYVVLCIVILQPITLQVTRLLHNYKLNKSQCITMLITWNTICLISLYQCMYSHSIYYTSYIPAIISYSIPLLSDTVQNILQYNTLQLNNNYDYNNNIIKLITTLLISFATCGVVCILELPFYHILGMGIYNHTNSRLSLRSILYAIQQYIRVAIRAHDLLHNVHKDIKHTCHDDIVKIIVFIL